MFTAAGLGEAEPRLRFPREGRLCAVQEGAGGGGKVALGASGTSGGAEDTRGAASLVFR